MVSKDILFMLLMLSLSEVIVTKGKEFCQSFKANNYEIDFGYYDILNDRYIVIGEEYWTLSNKWTGKTLGLEFKSKESRDFNWFRKEYNIAFETKFCEYIDVAEVCNCLTGLLRVRHSPFSLNVCLIARIDFRGTRRAPPLP